MRFLITTLAEYQTRFWAGIGIELKRLGHEPAFISFDDRSTEMLRADGLRVYSSSECARRTLPSTDADVEAQLRRFALGNPNHWYTHERFAFGLRDSPTLARKLLAALTVAEDACESFATDGSVALVQELGGFLSVVGSYFAARRHGIDNWFIEPSFFRGRMFLLRNTFAALRTPISADAPVPPHVSCYLAETVSNGTIVIPRKDQHQYTTAWKKVVNWRNARRLAAKLLDKHLHRKSQEFRYIGSHVATHARMLRNSLRMRNRYLPLEALGPFVYYPLHVPGDMALTLRSPEYLDQLALIDFICRAVPHTHVVAVKEHPAMIGAVDASRLLALLRRYDYLVVLPPSTNNYRVLQKAGAVISVNSKSGAEAALLGKPVLVLGDAFYRCAPIVQPIGHLRELPDALATALASEGGPPPQDDRIPKYFASVWAQSFAGELYVASADNLRTFTASLIDATRRPAS